MNAPIVAARASAWSPVLLASVLFLACGPSSDGAEAQAGGESSATACATCGLTVSNVSQNGGAGTVTSWGNQISCGSSCYYRYTNGTVVTLTAKAASSSSRFVGWGAPCNNGAATCAVTMNQDRTVTATFAGVGPTYPITVTRSGSGAGAVRSTPAGIDCGTTCTASWARDTRVTLTATATSPSVFAGWSGPCTGTSAICVVPLTRATSVGAAFTGGSELSLLVTVSGNGLVYDNATGISCPGTCSTVLPSGTAVTLTAHASDIATFAGWSGACQGSATTCVVTAAPGVQVGASFAPASASYLLDVTTNGGSVTLTTASGSQRCNGDMAACGFWYPSGTVVTLTAGAPYGRAVAGWTGDCTGTDPTCTLVMTQDRIATPLFAPRSDYSLEVSSGGGKVFIYYWWRADDRMMTQANGYFTCGPDVASCTLSFPSGAALELTTTAPPGKVFASWTGDCTSKDLPTCDLTVYGNHTVGATFKDAPTSTCKVTYAVNSQWPGGFNAGLVIQNTGTAAWKDWTLTWTFPSSAQNVTQLWNGTYSQTGSTVTVRSTGDNGAVPAGGSYSSVGFLGSWSGSNPVPTSFSVNGSPCN